MIYRQGADTPEKGYEWLKIRCKHERLCARSERTFI